MKYENEKVAIKIWILSIVHVLLVWLWKSVRRAYCSIGGDKGYESLCLLKQNRLPFETMCFYLFRLFNEELMVVAKMLGLYLSTLLICHKSCNMLNKLTLQRNCKISWHIIWFCTKCKNATTTKRKIEHKPPTGAGNGTLAQKADATENVDCSQAI